MVGGQEIRDLGPAHVVRQQAARAKIDEGARNPLHVGYRVLRDVGCGIGRRATRQDLDTFGVVAARSAQEAWAQVPQPSDIERGARKVGAARRTNVEQLQKDFVADQRERPEFSVAQRAASGDSRISGG